MVGHLVDSAVDPDALAAPGDDGDVQQPLAPDPAHDVVLPVDVDGSLHAASLNRNHSTVFCMPDARSVRGTQPSSFVARVMSGHRLSGSSIGRGTFLIATVPIRAARSTWAAISRTECSVGLPMFTGPSGGGSISMSRTRPSTRSST